MNSLLRLRAARLFDGVDFLDRPVVVEVADGVVARTLSEPGVGALPCQDLGDVTLMPGLVDAHTHLAFAADDSPCYGLPVADDQLMARIEANAQRAVRAGITAVRDLGDPAFAVLRAAGRVRSLPAIAAAGPPLTIPGGHCHFLGGAVAGARAIADTVNRWADNGVDIIKVMCTGGVGTPGSDPVRAQFDVADLRVLVDAAHNRGLPVTAHAHGAEGIAAAVKAGVDGLEHAKFWSDSGIEPDPSVIDEIASRGIWVCPTLGELPGSAPPPPPVAQRAAAAADVVRQMWQAGVSLVAGSDAGICAAKPHDALSYSIESLAACGMGALAALRAATSLASDACGFVSKGRVRPGYDADLIAVDGNPVRDLAVLRQVTSVWIAGHEVMSEGISRVGSS